MDVRHLSPPPTTGARHVRVLLLAGTAEAHELSHRLDALPDVDVVVSLAGRTSAAAAHGGAVRVGPFGGTDGLAQYLTEERIEALVDATHPFATAISANATLAATRCGVPRIQVVRPPWKPGEGDHWIEVPDAAGAARAMTGLEVERVLLTVGQRDLSAFEGAVSVHLVVRTIEPVPRSHMFADAVFIQARGPFTIGNERALLRHHRIDAVVTKNSGGNDAKLVTARKLRLPVIMVHRPRPAPGDTAHDAAGTITWLRSTRRS